MVGKTTHRKESFAGKKGVQDTELIERARENKARLKTLITSFSMFLSGFIFRCNLQSTIVCNNHCTLTLFMVTLIFLCSFFHFLSHFRQFLFLCCPGVEFAAELRDFVGNEISKLYPSIKDKIKLTLIGGYRGVLSTYDQEVCIMSSCIVSFLGLLIFLLIICFILSFFVAYESNFWHSEK